MARVIISSGHSSANPGSMANGLREVDVARQIAKATLKHLRFNGIISLSVPLEMELLERIEWINRTGYTVTTNDIAIEIHINDGGKSGIEAWFEGDGMNASQQLAEFILAGAANESKLQSQGAKSEYVHEIGSISYIHETKTISALIECGYIDNESDANFLKNPDNIDLVGKGIAKGICRFYNIEFRDSQMVAPQIQNVQTVQNTPVQQTNSQQNAYPIQNQNQQIQPIQQQPINTFNNTATTVNQTPDQNVVQNVPAQRPFASQPATQGPINPPQVILSRDERKDMIIRNYKKILGREPNTNDLNYFLNVGIHEADLIKKMMESQEHVDMVKAKEELAKIKKESSDNAYELGQLRIICEDQKKVIEGLNYTIAQKNSALQNYQNYYTQLQKSQKGSKSNPAVIPPANTPKGYKGSFLDRLFKAFSDLFE
jgi:hypothetical protein